MANDKRKLLREIFDAAVARAHPARVLASHLPPPSVGRVICLAAGKAAGAIQLAEPPPDSSASTRSSFVAVAARRNVSSAACKPA